MVVRPFHRGFFPVY